MILNREDCNGIILLLLLLMNCLLFIVPNIYNSLANILFIGNFLLVCFGMLINGKYIFANKMNLIFFFFLMSFAVFSLLFNEGGFGSIINLFTSICGVLLFSDCKIGNVPKKVVFYLCIVLYFILFVLSLNSWNLYAKGVSEINPNSVGVAILLCYSAIYLYIYNSSKKINDIFFILFTIVTLYAIYHTNCRSALLGIILFFLANFLPKIGKIISNNKKAIFLAVIIIGILFPLIYIEMYKRNINFSIPFIGKRMYTGREQLWMYMIESMKQTKNGFLFGVGTNNVTGIGIISNAHNWYLSILYSFGSLAFAVYFMMFLSKINKCTNEKILLALLIVFLIGFVETAAMGTVCKTFIFVIFTMNSFNKEVSTSFEVRK